MCPKWPLAASDTNAFVQVVASNIEKWKLLHAVKIHPQSLFLILVDVGGCSPKVVPSFSSPSGPMRKHQFHWWFFWGWPGNQKEKTYINIAHMSLFLSKVYIIPPNECIPSIVSLTLTPATCICRAAKVVSENSSHAEKHHCFFSKKSLDYEVIFERYILFGSTINSKIVRGLHLKLTQKDPSKKKKRCLRNLSKRSTDFSFKIFHQKLGKKSSGICFTSW